MPDLKKMLTLEALSEALPSWLKRSTKPEYNADEIDSTLTTNQFVSASDKENWNAKGTYSKPPGGIPKSDLSSIVQESLEKADSALQSETDPTVPSWAKQTNKPSYTQDEVADGSTYKRVTQTEKDAWSGKQNALTTTQMQAVNSGITSEKVTQISTNQTDISSVQNATEELVNKGAKNCFPPANTIAITPGYGTSFSTTNDSITLSTSGNYAYANRALAFPIKAGSYNFSFTVSNLTGSNDTFISLRANGTSQSGEIVKKSFTGNGNVNVDFTASADMTLYVLFYASGSTYTDTTSYKASNLMITSQSEYGVSSDYASYALGNQMLTPAVIKTVDNGAKNRFNFDAWRTVTSNRANLSFSGSSVTLESFIADAFTAYEVDPSKSSRFPSEALIPFTIGEHIVLTWDYTANSGQSDDKVFIFAYDSAYQQVNAGNTLAQNKKIQMSIPSGTAYVTIRVGVTTSGNSATYSNIMICSTSEYNISAKYEPHGLGNQYLTPALIEQVNNGSKNKLTSVIESDSTSDYTITRNADNTYTISISNTVTGNHYYNFEYNIGSKYVGYVLSAGGSEKVGFVISKPSGVGAITTMNNKVGIIPADATNRVFISILDGAPAQTITLKPMICSVADWNISHDYQPHAASNYELTKRESEDRSNMLLLERMNGAKNYIDSEVKSQTITTGGANITVTVKPDKSFEIIGTTGSSDVFIGVCEETVLPAGDYVLSGLRSSAGNGLYLYMAQGGSYVHITSGSYPTAEFSINSNQAYVVAIHLEPNKSYSTPQKIYPMISDKSAWDSGLTQYMPYALSNADLTKALTTKAPMLSGAITSGDLNDITISTFAMYANTVSSLPTSDNYYVETSVFDANSLLQRAYNIATAESYVRVKCVGTWSAWKQITNA